MMGTAAAFDIAPPEEHLRAVASASHDRRSVIPTTHPGKVHLPNFFLVGAAKAGTTSLYHYLKSHPQI